MSPSGIAPAPRNSRMSFDFPSPCSPILIPAPTATGQLTYPFPLATIIVDGDPIDMAIARRTTACAQGPAEHRDDASIQRRMQSATWRSRFAVKVKGTQMETPDGRLPSCGWYIDEVRCPQHWGGAPFQTLEMLRDDDDKGTPNNDPKVPLVGFKKEGLFTPDQPLFPDMIAGNYEEWTVVNRSFSDHPFHIHQNHFLVTKINGQRCRCPNGTTPSSCPEHNRNRPTLFARIAKYQQTSLWFDHLQNVSQPGSGRLLCHALPHPNP